MVKYCRVPSPIGHGLAGIAAGTLALTRARSQLPAASFQLGAGSSKLEAGSWKLLAAAGMAPDLDLLFGAHSGPTHGVGAAILVGVLAWGVLRARGAQGSGRFSMAIAMAYASHILLDWLGSDTSAPIGIMALWPFSREFYESSAHVFMAITRRYWLPEFWRHNFLAVVRELVILVPVVALVVWIRRRR